MTLGLVSNYNYILNENGSWQKWNTSSHIGQVNQKYIAFPKQIFLYAQNLGNQNISFNGSTYNNILSLNPLPTNYDNNSASVADLDYTETGNLTNTNESIVIDKEFILLDKFHKRLKIFGIQKAVADCTCKGDGTYSTTLTKVNFKLYKRGNNNQSLLADSTYTLSTALSQTANSYADPLSFLAIFDLNEIELDINEKLLLKLQVYGYINTSSTDNKIKLNHARGSADTYLQINILEE